MIFHYAVVDDALGTSRANGWPWHSTASVEMFRFLTAGSNLVMGRMMYEAMSRGQNIQESLFPDQICVVLSRDRRFRAKGAMVINSWNKYLEYAEITPDINTAVIGGYGAYMCSLEKTAAVYLCHVAGDYGCDVRYPVDVNQLNILGYDEAESIYMNNKLQIEFPYEPKDIPGQPHVQLRAFYKQELMRQNSLMSVNLKTAS